MNAPKRWPTPSQDTQRTDFVSPGDAAELGALLERYERGELTADQWRAARAPFGLHNQRQEGDAHMLRAKVPQGILLARHLEALADIAEARGRGQVHLTTRQNVQFDFLTAREAVAVVDDLERAGLTTRHAGGNTVRNVTTCPLAGVAAGELFDVTPYAEAFTRYFLHHPLGATLPRKVKVAFEGCPEDHAATAIHDLSFCARLGPAGERGFEVRVGGGTGTLPTSTRVLNAFVPAGKVLEVAEAVIRVFHRLGERERREAARLKYLIRRLGWAGFETEFLDAWEAVQSEGGVALPFDTARASDEGPPALPRATLPPPEAVVEWVKRPAGRGAGYEASVQQELAPSPARFQTWLRDSVRPQRQPGYVVVEVAVPQGDITAGQLRALAAFSRSFGDGAVRLTRTQGVLLRWISEAELPALYPWLAATGLGRSGAGTGADVTCCTGADACPKALTHTKKVARSLEEHLRARPELAEKLQRLSVKVSGCPNGCSQHHVAGIGLQGSTRQVGGRTVPEYLVLVGGGWSGSGARFGRSAGRVSEAHVGEAVEGLLRLFEVEKEPGESGDDFFARVELGRAKAVLGEFKAVSVHAPEETRTEKAARAVEVLEVTG
jgi:sulfite reductase beta subunit-like hemoprotein